jgi:hypothetical protein
MKENHSEEAAQNVDAQHAAVRQAILPLSYAPKALSCGGAALGGCSGRFIAEQRETITHEKSSAPVLPQRM